MTERVARIKPIVIEEDRPSFYFQGRNETDPLLVTPRFNQNPTEAMNDRLAGVTFSVYTASEIDEALHNQSAATTVAQAEADSRTDRKLVEFATTLRAEMVQAIAALPQRILMREAGQALKDAVLLDLRQELAQLSADLEAKIDALRNQ